MSVKTLREDLCRHQAGADGVADPARFLPLDVRVKVADLINLLDFHRPVGPDGKHGQRHTTTCGCEDK